MEALDQPGGIELADVALNVGQKPASQFESEYLKDMLGGMVVLRHKGVAYQRAETAAGLYSRYSSQPPKTRQIPLTFIPYYAWANRQATEMQVWTPLSNA
jgi:hypothetical protein